MSEELLVIGGVALGAAVLGAALGALLVPWWAVRNIQSGVRVGPGSRVLAAVVLAVVFAVLVWRTAPVTLVPAVLSFAVVGIAVAVVDLLERRIPNRMLLVGGAVVAVLLVAGLILSGSVWGLLGALIGGAAMFGLYLLIALVARSAMGMGDVKLAALIGAVLGAFGWTTWVTGLVAAFVLGGIAALIALIARRAGWRDTIPFGPWMVLGAVLALVL